MTLEELKAQIQAKDPTDAPTYAEMLALIAEVQANRKAIRSEEESRLIDGRMLFWLAAIAIVISLGAVAAAL